jgi:hypothetical protein
VPRWLVMVVTEQRREQIQRNIVMALRHRDTNGGHLHHRDCIHNLPPEEQVTVRGKTVEWWMRTIGPLPVQITPDEWETEPPNWVEVPND